MGTPLNLELSLPPLSSYCAQPKVSKNSSILEKAVGSIATAQLVADVPQGVYSAQLWQPGLGGTCTSPEPA